MYVADTLLITGKHPLRISLESRRLRVVVQLRYQYEDAKGVLQPGMRGVAIPAEYLPEIQTALEKIRLQLVKDGCFSDSDPPRISFNAYPDDF